MAPPLKTVLHPTHLQAGAQMVPFGGWDMPLQYGGGIVSEHLATRKNAGLFDVSHMGRLIIGGTDALAFLQHVLSNNAAALEVGESQYTLIPNADGSVVDDAYLYRFEPEEYLLVVNAANREKDLGHFETVKGRFADLTITDRTFDTAMLSLQGPRSKQLLQALLAAGRLPEPMRNALDTVVIDGTTIQIARTGYTGEPLCFELFLDARAAPAIWDRLVAQGAEPVGLGARDTLRLEAGLPLYGHELGADPEGRPIPAFAMGLSRFAVSISPFKGDFIGRQSFEKQFLAVQGILNRNFGNMADLPRRIMALSILGKGVARAGCQVFARGRHAGVVTSGTMVPFWKFHGEGIAAHISEEKGMRAIALALVDSDLMEEETVEVDVRGRRIAARIVPYHLRSEAPPFARAITCHDLPAVRPPAPADPQWVKKAGDLLAKAVENTRWRQHQCINLIPSEQTPSAAARLLSVADPACRYAEHKPVKAFCEAEVFYYQGTDFIAEVEERLNQEFRRYLGCAQVETRPISGQMANTAVFSAMVDFLNRGDRKSEQRRMAKVMNHHIIRGGHLSAQPMGALRDFVARDPKTEKPAVVNFPVLADNPYQIDVAACRELMAEHRPELVILGKSMTLHREPVAEIRRMVDELGIACTVMYDMAHVLGLAGPCFQDPFKEGAHLVTGSTHKTYFGTQRGVIAGNWAESDLEFELWEAIGRRAFPGSVSNHHLGTLVGLLMAAYEMNAFKESYQKAVIDNAKAFATALKDCGLDVAGDPAISFTETHQVIVRVGYARGPEIARRLEENNIVVNYQAVPEEEGFTASGALRMGVSEMTRFGMGPADFGQIARFIHDVVVKDRQIGKAIADFRGRFVDMQYCFSGSQIDRQLSDLVALIRP
ncbi:MAG: glycine cleavage system aminomethyltransferase GcvT [Desulfobacterales bacterium]|nr:glycine cleavage system aminomethyltransferase GcvT [Desulfobacterales bacterium]